MGRPPKLTLVNKKHFTKAEKKKRQELEDKLLNGVRNNKVKPPTWLSSKAKKLFKEIAQELIEIKLISNLDVNALSLYCDYYIKLLEINEQLEHEGETIEYTNKAKATNKIENPKLKIKNKYLEVITKLSKEFGLTPASRFRLTATQDSKEENKVYDFYREFFDEQS